MAYQHSHGLLPAQALVRLDGLYGNGTIVADLMTAGVGWVMRGKDYGLLDLPQVKEHLALAADEQFTHPESGTCRDLFDCGELPVTAEGHRSRVIVATHQVSTTASPVGVTRDGVAYELFFTALPASGFTAADVVKLASRIGAASRRCLPMRIASKIVIGGVPTRRMVRKPGKSLRNGCGILRQELSQQWQPTTMRLTEFAPAQAETQPASDQSSADPSFGPPQWARAARVGSFGGEDFVPQSDGTLRCPHGATLYPQERRPEHDGTLRVLYAARIADCRSCPLRPQCQGHGAATNKPRRVSAVLHPQPQPPPQPASEERAPPYLPATHPLLWADWSRCQPRRAWIQWQRSHLVTVNAPPVSSPPSTPSLLSRAERAHWRLSWEQRLVRNARSSTAPPVEITVYGLPTVFAQTLGLRVA